MENNMSTNLHFIDNNFNYVDFPYQTTTKVTRAVLAAGSRSLRMKIIRRDLISRNIDSPSRMCRWGKRKYREVKAMLRNKDLKLISF